MLCWGQGSTQSVQCLPGKHEDLNLIPDHVKGRVWCHELVITVLRRSLGLLVNQQSQTNEFQAKVRDCLK